MRTGFSYPVVPAWAVALGILVIVGLLIMRARANRR
jgi:hypothetical protein